MILIIPLFTSVNIRVFGWALFLVKNGVLDSIVSLFGVSNYPTLMYQRSTIILGTVYVYLPFMLFPIYLSILSIDDATFEAANDPQGDQGDRVPEDPVADELPGRRHRVAVRVRPQPPGADVEAKILGGGSIFTMASNIQYSFGYSQNWPLGSAQAIGLLLITVVAGIIILRTIDLQEIASRGD